MFTMFAAGYNRCTSQRCQREEENKHVKYTGTDRGHPDVTAADIQASNGVIHVTGTVMVPETFKLVP